MNGSKFPREHGGFSQSQSQIYSKNFSNQSMVADCAHTNPTMLVSTIV